MDTLLRGCLLEASALPSPALPAGLEWVLMQLGPSVHSLGLPHHAMTQTLKVAPCGLHVTLPAQGMGCPAGPEGP